MKAVTTYWTRRQIAKAVLGTDNAPVPTHIAFGTGGWTGSPNDPLPPSGDDSSLGAEVLRKEIDSREIVGDSETRVLVRGHVEGDEVEGEVLTEVGILTAQGDLMGRQTFKGKGMEVQTRIDFELEIIL